MPKRGGSESLANVGQSRLVMDLERAIGKDLSIAEKFIGSCRSATGLALSSEYDADQLIDGLRDAQKHFDAAEKNHADFHATSLAARRHAAGITAAMLCRFFK